MHRLQALRPLSHLLHELGVAARDGRQLLARKGERLLLLARLHERRELAPPHLEQDLLAQKGWCTWQHALEMARTLIVGDSISAEGHIDLPPATSVETDLHPLHS